MYMRGHATDTKALFPGPRKLPENALCLHGMTGLAAAHAACSFASHKKSLAAAKLHANCVVFQLKVQKVLTMPAGCCGM